MGRTPRRSGKNRHGFRRKQLEGVRPFRPRLGGTGFLPPLLEVTQHLRKLFLGPALASDLKHSMPGGQSALTWGCLLTESLEQRGRANALYTRGFSAPSSLKRRMQASPADEFEAGDQRAALHVGPRLVVQRCQL